MNPKYPIYIISKGRWESRLTSKAFERMRVPYKIVVEPQEYDNYAEHISKDKILTLPFSNLGLGSIPARNWVWEHSIGLGFERHWIFDDNILDFYRLNENKRIHVDSGTIFAVMEDFVDRYENIAIAGPNYMGFAVARAKLPPFITNTRIYSMLLIKNDLPYRWRGKYNEDTDLSLRALKDGWCTVQFYAFLGDKSATMKMKGGNTDEIYNTGDKRLEFAKSLSELHPDVAKVVWRYDRWHHQVNYEPFKKNKLIFKQGVQIKKGVDNFGMVLKRVKDGVETN